MTIKKAHIIENIKNSNGVTRKKSAETLEVLIKIIKDTLASGEDIMISGFGKFYVQEKQERRGRNPSTGAELMLKPRKVVRFRCSGNLRDRINRE